MIAKDKLQHMIMGFGVCAALLVLSHVPLSYAMLLSCLIFGVFYEAQQWYRKEGTPDVWDVVATTVPGLVAFLVLEGHAWTR